MRIIVVEDDTDIASFIVKGLKEAGFTADHVQTAEDALELFSSMQHGGLSYDAAIIDLMLPGMDGLSLIEQIRRRGIITPILILSAKRSLDDRIIGLQKGGDDYLTKPFSFAELLARIRALVRRSSMKQPIQTVFSFADLTIDLLSHTVTRAGKQIDLNPKEFALLEYFMRNAGNVLTKTMIMEHIWDYHFDPQTNVVDVLACRLRNKIDKGFESRLIHTIRGVGYVLKEDSNIS
ncbi:MAG TPA: response regulator transcription factor [Spirochaetia bacterium]|jgi:DNA-binding response OmpR family regulator|nr:response regulator transcription factor [Spirochaetia bacterium]